jgi:predicted O-methyltransferase YrrM
VVVQASAIAAYLAELTAEEDDVLRHARERASAGGMPPVSADAGAFLRFAAGWVGAQAAVEVGSGAGYSGVWIARGLAPKGVLTTIEADPEHQRLAMEHALRLVRPGGVVLADNVLWSGRVADAKADDPDTEGLRAYARRIAGDERLDSVILTVGDGLSVSRVRRPDELGG